MSLRASHRAPHAVAVASGIVALGAQSGEPNKEQGRLENCGVVMEEILDVPDNIPKELLDHPLLLTRRLLLPVRVPALLISLIDLARLCQLHLPHRAACSCSWRCCDCRSCLSRACSCFRAC